MVGVFITIDTEISSPLGPAWRTHGLQHELERDVFGRTAEGPFGIEYQMEVFDRHRLKATFFVEALFAAEGGIEPLRAMVDSVRGRGHDVQLHLHTEWLSRFGTNPLGVKTGQHIRDFGVEDQARLLRLGLAHMEQAGASTISSYRAGNFGASWETLEALGRAGLRTDTSMNPAHFGGACRMPVPAVPTGLVERHGVLEFPVTVFEDRPGHYRPLQVCACSSEEMEAVLLQASRDDVPFLVLVTHSFELLKRDKRGNDGSGFWRPSRIRIRRFERLCRFLDEHRNEFETLTFSSPALDGPRFRGPHRMMRSTPLRTARRVAEQLWDRVW